MRVRRILVPTDFSENAQVAVETGYELARQLGADLYLLHVQDESTVKMAVKEQLLREDSTDEELQTEVRQLIEMRFSRTLAGLGAPDVRIERVHRRGDPKVVAIAYAKEIDADVLVVGLRGAGVLEKIRSAVLGSVAEHLVKNSPCPTLVVRLEHKSS